MKNRKDNFCTYETAAGPFECKFNIYQGRSGGIYLTMGNGTICLNTAMIDVLPIDLTALKDFNCPDYDKFYGITQKQYTTKTQ